MADAILPHPAATTQENVCVELSQEVVISGQILLVEPDRLREYSGMQTEITATLSVRDWSSAMDFYKAAFGAVELFSIPGGGVGQLAVNGARFWVAEESKDHQNFSPQSLGGCSVRMLLIVEDPAAIIAQAVRAGATLIRPATDEHGWRLGRIVDPAGHHWEIGRPL